MTSHDSSHALKTDEQRPPVSVQSIVTLSDLHQELRQLNRHMENLFALIAAFMDGYLGQNHPADSSAVFVADESDS